MMNNKRLQILSFPVLTSLLLVACGGGGEPQASVPDSSSTLSAADHAELGLEYFDQGDFEEAHDQFDIAIELDPDHAEVHRNLATLHVSQGRLEQGITGYQRAIELDPDFGEAYGDMAGVFFNSGRIPEAIAAAERGIELSPEYAMSYNNLAIIRGSQGDVDQAITLLEQAIQIDPNCDDAQYNLGYAYEILGQFNEAVVSYQEAIRINPDYADANQNLGNIYANTGRLDDAIYYWNRTLEIDPERTETYKYLGILYSQQNNFEEAIEVFETYLDQTSIEVAERALVEGWIAELEGVPADAIDEYSNASLGFSISYPAGWYVVENGARTSFAPTRQAYEAPELESLLVNFVVGPLDQMARSFGLDQNSSPEEFLILLAENVEAEVEEMDSFQIAGYPAAIAVTSGTVMDSSFRGNMIIILVDERVFVVDGIAPPDQWDAYGPTLVDMVNSLVFF